MDRKIIPLLECPYCRSQFKIGRVFRAFPKQGKIRFGYLSCACDVFPIVEGILYLKKTEPPSLKNQTAVDLLIHGQHQQAINLLFDERRRAKLPYAWLMGDLFQPKTIQDFLKLLKLFIPESKSWLAHLAERERRPTFFLSLANLAYVKNKQIAVDVGCSVGWFLRQLLKQTQTTAIGIETSFSALFLARKFILKTQGNLICADADFGLPFRTGAVDRVFANDTFMYLKKKRFFLEESTRIGRKEAVIFLSHVHSALAENDGQGYGITPQELSNYGQDFQIWETADEHLYQSLTNDQHHSYGPHTARSSILKHRSCSLVITRGKFKPQLSPNWVGHLLVRTSLNFIEDPQLKS